MDDDTILSHLNLNGLCNKKDDLNIGFIEEIILPDRSINTLSDLHVLSLRSNNIQIFPSSILKLTSLKILDLSDNNLLTIPQEINKLIK